MQSKKCCIGTLGLLQEVVQPDGKPMLSKAVEGLLDELTDVLGAFEHMAPPEGKQAQTVFHSPYGLVLKLLDNNILRLMDFKYCNGLV